MVPIVHLPLSQVLYSIPKALLYSHSSSSSAEDRQSPVQRPRSGGAGAAPHEDLSVLPAVETLVACMVNGWGEYFYINKALNVCVCRDDLELSSVKDLVYSKSPELVALGGEF